MSKFTSKITFTGGGLDLLEDRRETEHIKAYLAQPKARALLIHKGQPALEKDGALYWFHPSALKGQNIFHPVPLLLGRDEDGPVFAFHLTEEQTLVPADSFQELRQAARTLDTKSMALAGQARSLFDWHYNHRFCAKCGKESQPIGAGQSRVCPSCQAQHFPRVNPVVIMLILDGENCLLGRNENWPEGAYSALAGFVSPGESMEEACRREAKEESALDVTDITYVFSQPWPFPSQLMLGLSCRAQNPDDLKINPRELEDAKWFSKAEVRAVFDGDSQVFLRPPSFTIAHELLRYWLSVDDLP